MEIRFKLLDSTLPPPRYLHAGDAGLDLPSRIDAVIEPGERTTIPTGIAIAIPAGYAGFVLPRSGLAMRNGIVLVNSPGLIDSGYRGEIAVVMLNTDRREPFKIARGDRIAQLVIQKMESVTLVQAEELDSTERGTGGFGSTGSSSGSAR
jgi:dUTP pyrophosphatase